MTAGLYLHTIIFACLLRPTHTHNINGKPEYLENLESDDKQVAKKTLWKECTRNIHLLKNIQFALFIAHMLLISFGTSSIFVHMGAFTHTKGISEDKSAMLYVMFGVGSATARPLSGLLSQVKCFGPKRLHFVTINLLGAATILFPFGSNYAMFGAGATFIGIFYAAHGALPAIITVELVGVDNLASAYGYVSISCAIGFALGGPFSGKFVDSSALNNLLQMKAAKCNCLFSNNYIFSY